MNTERATNIHWVSWWTRKFVSLEKWKRNKSWRSCCFTSKKSMF